MTPADIGLTWKEVLYLTFVAGFVWFELKAIRRDIKRLETKVEKHNNFDRRIIRLETLVEVQEQHLCQNSQTQANND